jgi:hypothetical protein
MSIKLPNDFGAQVNRIHDSFVNAQVSSDPTIRLEAFRKALIGSCALLRSISLSELQDSLAQISAEQVLDFEHFLELESGLLVAFNIKPTAVAAILSSIEVVKAGGGRVPLAREAYERFITARDEICNLASGQINIAKQTAARKQWFKVSGCLLILADVTTIAASLGQGALAGTSIPFGIALASGNVPK